MQIFSVRWPPFTTLLLWAFVGVLAMATTKAFEIHTESVTDILFSILLAHIVGTILGISFAAILRARDGESPEEHRHSQAAVVGYFTIGTPLFFIVGWILWQPWLWLTR